MTRQGPAHPINLRDYERLARSVMDPQIWDTYAQGSEDERTLRANERAWGDVWLRPRTLVDVTACDVSTTALGAPLAMPVMIAPMSLQALAHPDAERATARAASAQGAAMVASMLSSLPLEQIAAAARSVDGGGLIWFQFYLYPDEAFNVAMLRRVERAGYQAVVLTVDAPYIGNRERDRRNQFAPPPAFSFGNFADAPHVTWATRGQRLPLTWQTIDWLRAHTSLPIVLKGVLTGEDARRALDTGVQGIAVSNHGGRQLDGTIPTRYALPEVVAAVEGRCEVYVDGGIRRGVDILRALALGARAVLIGRPIIWGLAADGEEGVRATLGILRDELTLALRLAGRASLAAVDATLIADIPPQRIGLYQTSEQASCDD